VWDGTTPVEEVLRGLDDLVRAGKILYTGISDTPAWQVARMQTIADLRGWSPLVALQIEYSLIERTVERDLIPMAAELGLGVVPWSPLGGGVLTGKYTRADLDHDGGGNPEGTRKDVTAANGQLHERALSVAEVVKEVAGQLGVTPAQAAVAWTLRNPAVTAPIIGARTLAQAEDNFGALDVRFTDTQLAALDQASTIDLGFPHEMLRREMPRTVVFGTAKIEGVTV
jgi:aryl-alcohol dehydrogenase-like predicted oxidoreductase